jgi:hypothetical protein
MKIQLLDGPLFGLALILVGLATVEGMGQGPGKTPPGPKGKGKGPPLVKEDAYLKLLANPAIQKEIELIDSQYEQFQAIGPELRKKIEEILGPVDEAALSPPERNALREKLRSHEGEIQDWVRDRIDKILLPHQKRRLQELAMQADGAKALTDPSVVRELKFTQSQLDEMQRIREEEKSRRDEVKRQFPGGGKENGDLRKIEEDRIRREAEERTWAVLTKQQQRTWERLTGKSFDVGQLKGPPKGAKPLRDAAPLD